MKKSFPAALVCAAALLIPSTAYACPTDCSTSGGDSSTQLDVKDHASTQVDTDAAQKEVDRARSFLDAGADLSQDDLDCFLSKVLEGSYYDKDSRTVRTDASERVSEDVESSQSGTYDASRLARWLYEHEDTWQSLSQDYKLGDVLSFSTQSVTSQSSAEFFASIKVVAVYVGDGRVIYCANNGTDTQVREESIATLTAELNVTVSLVSRPCDLDTSTTAPSVAPSESATDQSCQRTCSSESSQSSSESSTNVSNENSQNSSSNSSNTSESSESTESSSSENSQSSSESTSSSNSSNTSESSESTESSSSENSRSSSESSTNVSSENSQNSSSESTESSSSENSQSSSENTSSESSQPSSESSVAAPQQSSSTTAPSSPSSSTSTKSSSRPSSLPRTGAGAVLPVASVAVLAAAAGGSILARRRSRV
ncbi:Prokaryotic membrane lipoprotein lipid attachment site profile [Propionibacterium ruminifibrarum]|uniref:Prokaryotic membrane lipoprotein lipid attachment site profile n=1 Tax=Propionibacterium ruminifibrarum TaxID=1962131 RepID=A0A375I6G2_9ACTN|nr:hypothetical protein [Propionibacterium ruminifibrarum]SPF69446.1 Prokaryotic membrane lipoprotein lipid attachment site profile [Propionibacterium ruminifibrarum]